RLDRVSHDGNPSPSRPPPLNGEEFPLVPLRRWGVPTDSPPRGGPEPAPDLIRGWGWVPRLPEAHRASEGGRTKTRSQTPCPNSTPRRSNFVCGRVTSGFAAVA